MDREHNASANISFGTHVTRTIEVFSLADRDGMNW